MKNRIINLTIKLMIVATVSTLLGILFGFKEYILIGTLGVLSVSLTQKDTLENGIKRFIDVIVGLTISSILVFLLGNHLYVHGIFLLLFIIVSFLLKIEVGLIPSIVLANQVFAANSLTINFIINLVGITFLASSVAIVICLIYPNNYNKEMVKNLKRIDDLLKDHLFMLALILKSNGDIKDFMKHHDLINDEFLKISLDVETKDKDKVISNDHRYLAYLYMRRNQLNYINHMYKSYVKIKKSHEYQNLISEYILQLLNSIGDDNKALIQLEKLNDLKLLFEKEALPKTRAEFETRAILFFIIEELGSMLEAKVKFHERYPNFKL